MEKNFLIRFSKKSPEINLFFLTSYFNSHVLQKILLSRMISSNQIARFESPIEYLKDELMYELDFMGKHP